MVPRHATPFQLGTPAADVRPAFCSHMKEDSIAGIYDTLQACAKFRNPRADRNRHAVHAYKDRNGKSTSRTWAPSAAATCVPKSSSTPHPTEVACATCFAGPAQIRKTSRNQGFDHQRLFALRYATRLNNIIDGNVLPIPEPAKATCAPSRYDWCTGPGGYLRMMRNAFDSDGPKPSTRRNLRNHLLTARSMRFQKTVASSTVRTKLLPVRYHFARASFNRTCGGVTPRPVGVDVLREEVMTTRRTYSLFAGGAMPHRKSTAQILGNNEFRNRSAATCNPNVLSGSFPVVNNIPPGGSREPGLWNDDMKKQNHGAQRFPSEHRAKSRTTSKRVQTVWEIKQKDLFDMAADAVDYPTEPSPSNVFIDQPRPRQTHQLSLLRLEKKASKRVVLHVATQISATPSNSPSAKDTVSIPKVAGRGTPALP
ncbi:hypothetical protein FQR65_LT20666 [Abscondita terminalis]|nr:hypothetical protein FQR65_LT20666 [Abscondita terminalis]